MRSFGRFWVDRQGPGREPVEGAANEYRTNDADLPACREKYRQWDPARVREWAARVGPAAVTVVNRIFESVPVDEQGVDAALAALPALLC